MPEFPTFDDWLPQPPQKPRGPAPQFDLRHVVDDDWTMLEARIRDWRAEPAGRGLLGRTWFRHFGGTSWLAEASEDQRPLGVLLGFHSADRPAEAVIHLVTVDPSFRRRGIGRDLVERFAGQLGGDGAASVTASCRPDDRIAASFFVALGFDPQAGPGSSRLYGVPAFADWDGPGEDRVLLVRAITG